MPATVADFQQNINHYLQLVSKQDVFIMQDGKIIAKLTQPQQDRVSATKSLFGILPQKTTWEEAMEERNKEILDYTEWQRAYFDAKSPAEISREAEQYEKDHPFQGNSVRLTRRLRPEDPDPIADIF